MQFGLSKVCITPEVGTELLGHPIQLETDGKYTDLYAKSVYFDSNSENLLIISCDLMALSKELIDRVRSRISKKTGIDFDNIVVHTTHTHAGPAVVGEFNGRICSTEAQEKIIEQIIDSGVKAFNSKITGRLGAGSENIYGISFNRRYVMKDGSVEMHPHKDDPNLLEAQGPNDPELNSIILFDNENNPVGALANFPCHLTSLERNNTKFSADFPYYAEENLKEKLVSDDFIMLYLNGACGNLCQVDVENRETAEVGDEHSRRAGKSFAEAIHKIIDNCEMLKDDASIDIAYREIEIPIRKITDKMLKKAKETIERYKGKEIKEFELSNYGLESYKDNTVISAQRLLETDFWKNMSANEIMYLANEYKDKKVTVPLTVARIGKIFLATNPAELFVEYSLMLKNRFKKKYKNIMIVELVNGWVGYVPTEKAFSSDSGYEVQFLNSSKLSEDAGEIITEKIIQMEKELG